MTTRLNLWVLLDAATGKLIRPGFSEPDRGMCVYPSRRDAERAARAHESLYGPRCAVGELAEGAKDDH